MACLLKFQDLGDTKRGCRKSYLGMEDKVADLAKVSHPARLKSQATLDPDWWSGKQNLRLVGLKKGNRLGALCLWTETWDLARILTNLSHMVLVIFLRYTPWEKVLIKRWRGYFGRTTAYVFLSIWLRSAHHSASYSFLRWKLCGNTRWSTHWRTWQCFDSHGGENSWALQTCRRQKTLYERRLRTRILEKIWRLETKTEDSTGPSK